jgi:phytoene dehydrogenase-like protein
VKARDFVIRTLFSRPIPPAELAERVTGPIGKEFLSYAQMGLYEAVDHNFEDDRIRCVFKTFLHAITLMDLPALGGFFPRLVSRLVSFKLPKGGSNAFTDALGQVVTDAGGTLVTGEHVDEIIVKDGRASGVRLASGDVLTADRFVASGVDVTQTLELAGEDHFGVDVAKKVADLQWSRHSLVTLHLALNEPPDYRAAEFEPNINEAFNMSFGVTTADELRGIFEAIDRQEMPQRMHGNGACNTLFDPSYAPPGKHSAFWWPFAPYALNGDPENWEDVRDDVTQDLLRQWREFAPNMTEQNVLGTYLFTPLDITCAHGLAVERLPALHRDPFDRKLVAQAQLEKLTIVTRDRNIPRYDVPVLDS